MTDLTETNTPTIDDLSRRYQALKDRFQEIKATRKAAGLGSTAAMPISISSRFMLRMVLLSKVTGLPVAELHVGVGELTISEAYLIDGEVFEI